MTLTHDRIKQYLDDLLPAEEAAEVERLIRASAAERAKVEAIRHQREEHLHTLRAIWRRHRLGCPSREVLGSYHLGALSAKWRDYVTFHLDVADCPYCQASLADLDRQRQESDQTRTQRRHRFFESSRGYVG